jgi:calcium/calmodulin-dependent protein kinase I
VSIAVELLLSFATLFWLLPSTFEHNLKIQTPHQKKMEIVEPGYTLGFEDAEEQTQLSFLDLYVRDNRLRSGSFGTVYTCHHQLHTDITYAVKILDRRKLKPKDDVAVFREVSILKLLKDLPHVVRLIDFFVEPETFCMVQVYAAGGDVFDRLAARSHYTEKDARDLAKILLETIAAIHEKNIVHRDLKPENLLLKSATEDTSILLADFGFARTVPESGCKTRCGTPAFVAPEILLGLPYNISVDLWSIGCLLYMLIGGYPPFQGANHRALFRKVRASDFIFHEAYFQTVSVSAKQLISGKSRGTPKVQAPPEVEVYRQGRGWGLVGQHLESRRY